ncbi:hypothetical protein [Nocardioides speluncae]|uniref:hypothetical protein n=1 Tax=Nocardioides speluncae TaxID=2670337 RepID=UPI0012B17823|nr:hypothetical protein [Nocardioides speluncae]
MTDTTAKIRAKGLESTGVTEEIANQMFTQVGRHFMAIVEMRVEEPHGPNAEGKRRVDLILTQVEPCNDDNLDSHLRELCRGLHYNRKLHDADQQLEIDTQDDIEPKVADVIAAGKAQHADLFAVPEPPADEDEPDEPDDEEPADEPDEEGAVWVERPDEPEEEDPAAG